MYIDNKTARDACRLLMDYQKVIDTFNCIFDEWEESEHPRDDEGKFAESGNPSVVGGSRTARPSTTPEERRKKIEGVKIDFDRDNTLPELNGEDNEYLRAGNKPILLKKEVIERNEWRHPDITKKEVNALIGGALYDNDEILSENRQGKENYHHFIKYSDKNHSAVLLEVSENKNNLEIVHFYKMNRKRLNKLEQRTGKKES